MATPLPPVDPDVKVPGRVAAAAAAADAAHRAIYQTGDPQPSDASPAPAPAPSPAPQPAPPPAQPPEPQHQPAPVQPQPGQPAAPQPGGDRAPAAGDLSPDEWRHRYLSMEGRYKQSAQSLGALQEQITEMGDELMRTQQALEQARRGGTIQQPQPPMPGTPEATGLTPEEIQAYGPELVQVIQRAARAAVMPDMQNLQNGVKRAVGQVSERVQGVTMRSVYQNLDAHIPNWAEINSSPRFKQWCALRDVYSGEIRGKLLNAAFQAADAPRVIAFFQGFLNEEQATGQLPDPQAPQPAPQPPRVPATTLEMLAAPGRARPAPGDTNPTAPADKPIFTRAQIAEFYAHVRAGTYSGREPEKNSIEQAIFAAQREGRVR